MLRCFFWFLLFNGRQTLLQPGPQPNEAPIGNAPTTMRESRTAAMEWQKVLKGFPEHKMQLC
jgi:hypothetical protein